MADILFENKNCLELMKKTNSKKKNNSNQRSLFRFKEPFTIKGFEFSLNKINRDNYQKKN